MMPFLVKFDSNGNRLWATYCGGSDFDQGADVATDAAGNVYMTGTTGSTTNIGTGGTHQPSSGGFQDAFLVKYNSSGTRLWGSYFGGTDQDYGFDIAVDASGNIVIGGSTSSTNSIASGGFQNVSGGDQDAFVAKFNPSGNTIWSTYYGGTGTEWGFGIATGPSGFIYLSGRTDSPNNIASGGFQNTFGGWADAYLVKFDAAGNRVWGTYYGGTGNDEGTDVAADAFGNVFLTSDTYTPNVGNCIATPYGFQNTLIGTENLCLAAFTSNGFRASATYYGNLHEEEARVTVNVFGDVYLAGTVKSTTGIASGGHQNTFGGGNWDGGIVKFATAVPHEEVIVPNDSLPPTPPIITTNPPIIITSVSIYNGGGISISNAVFKNFSPGAPLPASGSSIISFTCDFTGTYNSGSGAIPVSCTALLKQKVELVQTALPLRVFDTEIIQLDLIGGTLPAGVVIRESPTLHSYGQIWITDQGGSFRMSYFVDAL
ncbi:MAG: SBBP repeat-containing protein [Bacteroidetes bacterium]|nr:SBBP repeat-containing protein [Bacteroidota bacterium]